MQEELKNLAIEDFIWVIYIIVSISAILSNKFERDYVLYHQKKDEITFHKINETIFIVAIFIYLYFFYRNYQSKNNKYYTLSLFAATLFLVGGAIYLYVEHQVGHEAEIGFI